ncbi:MAG: peptide-binding protein [Nitrospinae bacterium]|nr:peptide-binding protein [Nitrospinota bacterium]
MRLIPLLLLPLLAVAACEPKPAAPPPPAQEKAAAGPTAADFGDLFVEASIGDASSLIPFLSGDSASSDIQGYVFTSLLTVDRDMNQIPELARSYDVSPDGLTITFHLHPGLVWQDGAPFTSDDLLFQYEMMVHPDVPSAYKEPFLQIAEATAPDPSTFVVRYAEPYAPALANIGGMTGLPRHLLRDVKPSDLAKHPLSRKPVGTGAYRLDRWEPQARVVLSANKGYFKKGEPRLAGVQYRIIPDTATQFLELKAGNIDMMGLDPLQYSRQTDGPTWDRFRKYRYLANAYTYIGYNLTRPLFRDVRVRRAITHAIDKQELVDGVLMGLGRPATGPMKPGTWAYTDQVAHYPFDPARAKALLAEAGWTDTDGDGVIDREGKPFAFTLVTNQGNAPRKKSAEIIQRRLKEVGMKVDLRVVEWSSFIKNFIDARDFDAIILGWSLGLDPDGYDIWHSSKTGPKEFNFISYANAEVDALLEKGRRTFDRAERTKAYHRIQEILAEEQPYTFLYVPEATPIVSARIEGIDPGPAGIGYNFPSWWVPKAKHLRGETAIAP